jgi:hypothetical protein
MVKVKDYNYETDIITNPDPLYGIGEKVYIGDCKDVLKVQSVCWITLKKSWAYTVTRQHGIIRAEDVLEKNVRAIG